MEKLVDYLKTKSKSDIIFYCIIVALLIFLCWQVLNHIPTQMTRIENKITKVEDKITKVEDKIDKILFYLLDDKEHNKKRK